MRKRTPFPPVFWVANGIEVLERFAYYGIYIGFGIYLERLDYSRGELGFIQSLFLFFSYTVPIVSGTFADRYGFKPVLIVAYLSYIPSILLLLATKSFSGIALTMLAIGLAAGIFKPLIAGTVRAVSDPTNKSLGFGIFYAMVNLGASFGPIVMGQLRVISWDYVFYVAAAAIVLMLIITIFFYREPPRQTQDARLRDKLREIGTVLSDTRFAAFLILLGLFFWLPFWAFLNLCALHVETCIDTAALYRSVESVAGTWIAGMLSQEKDGVRRIIGETIAHTGYIIVVLQFFVSLIFERFRPMPSFTFGLVVAAAGFFCIGRAGVSNPNLIFLGIFIFALGEMITSPRIQEYITWIAPKEKAGLYTGANFLATAIGSMLSGVTYTSWSGGFRDMGHPEYVWYLLAVHSIAAAAVFAAFARFAGEFKERES